VGNAETNAVRIARVRAEVTLVGRNRRFKHATDHAHHRAGIFVDECPSRAFFDDCRARCLVPSQIFRVK
jgi:hypothetical protein